MYAVMKFGIIFLMLGVLGVVAATLECCYCHKKINGNYLKTPEGKIFCSQKCYEKTLPRCKVCGKTLVNGAMKSGNDYYCSRECFETKLPVCHGCGKHSANGMIFKSDTDIFYCDDCAKLSKCFSCMLPAVNGFPLEDGRVMCKVCKPQAVWDVDQAEKIFNEVRDLMRKRFELSTSHRIKLRMIDLPSMQRRSPDYAPGVEMGLFVYDATIKTIKKDKLTIEGMKEETETFRENVSYTIFFLSGTPAKKLTEVFAHELGHDWMQEYYPEVKTLAIREGFAEYCAYQVNKLHNKEAMNQRIKSNTDPIYGGGFQTIYRIGGENGDFSAIKPFLRKCN